MATLQYKYKVILLGDAGVGKTSLFNRIKYGKFYAYGVRSATQGADVYDYTTTVGNDSLKVNCSTLESFKYKLDRQV